MLLDRECLPKRALEPIQTPTCAVMMRLIMLLLARDYDVVDYAVSGAQKELAETAYLQDRGV